MKLFKKTISLAIVLIMIISLIPTNIVNAAVGDSESNPILYRQSDTTNFPQAPNQGYVLLNKSADWVPNEDNVAKVTMSLQGKGVQKKTDVVLVIDRSGSMSDVIKEYEYNEVPVTFTSHNIQYFYEESSWFGLWHEWERRTSPNPSINFTAYVDDEGAIKGYKSGTMEVHGFSSDRGYKLYENSGSFSSWTSLNDNDCADALISIFQNKTSIGNIDGNQVNIVFPNNRNDLRNTRNNYTEGDKKIDSAKAAANTFVSSLLATKELRSLNKIGIVSYAGDVSTNSNLTNNKSILESAISDINANGGTNIQSGISGAQSLLNSSTADNKCIVVLSDGEPTYSYKATSAESTTSSDIDMNYPDDIDYKLTAFSTSSTKGSGNSYTYSSYNVNGRYINNNGVPTISQALMAKKSGIEMYSVGFDVSNNPDAIYTMLHVASSVDNFYLATDDLSNVFTNIAGKIFKAGTNAKVSNALGEDINIGYSFTVLQDAAHPITATQGSAVVSPDAKSINWDLGTSNTGGDITETPATLTYYIRLNVSGGKTIDPNQILNTSSSSSVTYKNYLGKWCKKDFPTSVLTAESGTLNVSYYLADKNGNPINSDGVTIPYKDRVPVSDSLNQAVSLGYSVKVSDYAKSINGYVNQSLTAKNEKGDTVADRIIATRSTIYLNFPYYIEPTYRVSYNGNGNTGGEVPSDNNAYKEGAAVTVLGNGSMVKSGYSFIGWSTTNNGPVEYTKNNSFKMPSHSMTLYAVWDKSQYTLTINYILEGGATFDTYKETLSVGQDYNVTSPTKDGWTANELVISGKMPSNDVTKSVYYKKNENKLINNTMYPSKGIDPIVASKSLYGVAANFEYTFGFKFESGQNEPTINLILTDPSDKYNLDNFKLYEGVSTTPISTANSFSELDKTKIKEGNTYTITYSLKCSEKDADLTLEVNIENMTNNGVLNPINITSKDMPGLQ